MLMNAERSALLIVDVQDKLAQHIYDWQSLLQNTLWLVRVARKIGVPVMATEQYPQGLGHTVAELAQELPAGAVAEKIHFSCAAEPCLRGLSGAERSQVVMCGMESHVCVMQSAIELKLAGKEVFVVSDAVGSRDPTNKACALERMRDYGIEIVSREMVAFEWLRQAGTPLFREINRQFLR
jgi:nicotinamidase-related amidase